MKREWKPRAKLARLGMTAVLLTLLPGCIRISPAIPSWPATSAIAGELTLAADSQFIVAATINGHPVRLRVEPGYAGIVLNADVAARIGLERSMWENDVLVGPIRMQGETGVAPVVIGTATDTRRIVWFEKSITSEADGIINMAQLPYRRVSLRLQPEQPRERPRAADGAGRVLEHHP